MSVTPLYAAFFGMLLVALSWRIQLLRKTQNGRMNENGHSQMTAATRAYDHLLEYTPMALLLMLLLEIEGTSAPVLHALGLTLVAARLLHLKGIKAPTGQSPLRTFATRLTWAQIVAASLLCVAQAFGLSY